MIKRLDYIQKIFKYIDKPVIKVLTGMRRVGKSTILLLVRQQLVENGVSEDNIVCINKESLKYDFIKNYEDLYGYITSLISQKKGNKYILIDEIQEIEGWEKAVSSFLAEKAGDVVITGSNANLLSSELATLISGRYIEIPVYPLGFREFLVFRGKNKSESDEEELKLYLKYGGLPGIHAFEFDDDVVYNYLNSILSTVLLKDVVKRNKIRDVSVLENITKYLMDNCGNITSAKSIADHFKFQKIKMSVDTVQNYILFLQKAFLFYKAQRYDLKGRRWLEFHDKIFMAEIGLRNGFIGYRDNDISGLLENVVYLELLRRGYRLSVGEIQGSEIDFIAEKQNEKVYYQVCFSLSSEAVIKREYGNLARIDDNYRKVVISTDKLFPDDRDGIEHQNLIDFLLESHN